jgi:hypothetical protein
MVIKYIPVRRSDAEAQSTENLPCQKNEIVLPRGGQNKEVA